MGGTNPHNMRRIQEEKHSAKGCQWVCETKARFHLTAHPEWVCIGGGGGAGYALFWGCMVIGHAGVLHLAIGLDLVEKQLA